MVRTLHTSMQDSLTFEPMTSPDAPQSWLPAHCLKHLLTDAYRHVYRHTYRHGHGAHRLRALFKRLSFPVSNVTGNIIIVILIGLLTVILIAIQNSFGIMNNPEIRIVFRPFLLLVMVMANPT